MAAINVNILVKNLYYSAFNICAYLYVDFLDFSCSIAPSTQKYRLVTSFTVNNDF